MSLSRNGSRRSCFSAATRQCAIRSIFQRCQLIIKLQQSEGNSEGVLVVFYQGQTSWQQLLKLDQTAHYLQLLLLKKDFFIGTGSSHRVLFPVGIQFSQVEVGHHEGIVERVLVGVQGQQGEDGQQEPLGDNLPAFPGDFIRLVDLFGLVKLDFQEKKLFEESFDLGPGFLHQLSALLQEFFVVGLVFEPHFFLYSVQFLAVGLQQLGLLIVLGDQFVDVVLIFSQVGQTRVILLPPPIAPDLLEQLHQIILGGVLPDTNNTALDQPPKQFSLSWLLLLGSVQHLGLLKQFYFHQQEHDNVFLDINHLSKGLLVPRLEHRYALPQQQPPESQVLQLALMPVVGNQGVVLLLGNELSQFQEAVTNICVVQTLVAGPDKQLQLFRVTPHLSFGLLQARVKVVDSLLF